jgi:redox-sensitive bicupin YhaK (pirin superfamily)
MYGFKNYEDGMGNIRKIQKVIKGRPVVEGAGVHLKRALGNEGAVSLFDPFLLLDDFHSSNPEEYLPGFPWHPHMDITLPAKSQFRHLIVKGRTAMAYVLEGAGYFDLGHDPYAFEEVEENYFDFNRECLFSPEHLVAFEDGDDVLVATEEKPVRLLLISGNPIHEPVAWYGPIVMNTQEELRTAFEEYQKGTFIKYKQPQKTEGRL